MLLRYSTSQDVGRSFMPAVMAALAAFVLASTLSALIGFSLAAPLIWEQGQVISLTLVRLGREFEVQAGLSQAGLSPSRFADGIGGIFGYLHDAAVLNRGVRWRLVEAASAGVFAALLHGAWVYRRTRPVDCRRHDRGPRFLFGAAAVASAVKALTGDIRRHGSGHLLAPGVYLSAMRERRNLLILGAPGSGKTRIILWLIEQLLAKWRANPKHTRLLLHDTTGEILDGLPVDDADFAALHPHKPGGWAWNIGADIRTLDDASTLASRLIPSQRPGGDNAVFDRGSTILCTGCIRMCQLKKGTGWTEADLLKVILLDGVSLRARLAVAHPEAASLLETDGDGGLTRTSASILLSMRAHVLQLLGPLARSWAKVPATRRLSFTTWLDGRGCAPGIVVLQRSARHAELSAMWIGAITDVVAAHACDEAYNRDGRMQVHLVLDEIAQMGVIGQGPLQDVLDVGRNKKLSVIAALQSLSQPRILAGREQAEAFLGRFATKVIGQLPKGLDTEEIVKHYTKTRWILPNRPLKPGERRVEPEEVPVVSEDQLEDELGVDEEGQVHALVLGLGDVLELTWPVQVWPKRR